MAYSNQGLNAATTASAKTDALRAELIAAGVLHTVATSYTVALASSTGIVGTAVNLTATPVGGGWPAGETLSPAIGGISGTFSPQTVTPTAGSTTPASFALTPGAAGTGTVTVTASPSMGTPAGVQLTVSAAAAQPVAPGQVTQLAAGTPTQTSVAVTYAAPAAGTAPITYAGLTQVGSAVAVANGGSFTATGGTFTRLTAGTAYMLLVKASNGAGSSTTVLSGTVTTAAATAPVVNQGAGNTVTPGGSNPYTYQLGTINEGTSRYISLSAEGIYNNINHAGVRIQNADGSTNGGTQYIFVSHSATDPNAGKGQENGYFGGEITNNRIVNLPVGTAVGDSLYIWLHTDDQPTPVQTGTVLTVWAGNATNTPPSSGAGTPTPSPTPTPTPTPSPTPTPTPTTAGGINASFAGPAGSQPTGTSAITFLNSFGPSAGSALDGNGNFVLQLGSGIGIFLANGPVADGDITVTLAAPGKIALSFSGIVANNQLSAYYTGASGNGNYSLNVIRNNSYDHYISETSVCPLASRWTLHKDGSNYSILGDGNLVYNVVNAEFPDNGIFGIRLYEGATAPLSIVSVTYLDKAQADAAYAAAHPPTMTVTGVG